MNEKERIIIFTTKGEYLGVNSSEFLFNNLHCEEIEISTNIQLGILNYWRCLNYNYSLQKFFFDDSNNPNVKNIKNFIVKDKDASYKINDHFPYKVIHDSDILTDKLGYIVENLNDKSAIKELCEMIKIKFPLDFIQKVIPKQKRYFYKIKDTNVYGYLCLDSDGKNRKINDFDGSSIDYVESVLNEIVNYFSDYQISDITLFRNREIYLIFHDKDLNLVENNLMLDEDQVNVKFVNDNLKLQKFIENNVVKVWVYKHTFGDIINLLQNEKYKTDDRFNSNLEDHSHIINTLINIPYKRKVYELKEELMINLLMGQNKTILNQVFEKYLKDIQRINSEKNNLISNFKTLILESGKDQESITFNVEVFFGKLISEMDNHIYY